MLKQTKQILLIAIASVVIIGILTAVILLAGGEGDGVAPTDIFKNPPNVTDIPVPTASIEDLIVPTPVPTADIEKPAAPGDYTLAPYTQKAGVEDYMYMYFRNGTVQTSTNRNLYIKSGRYGLSFDIAGNKLNKFGLCYGTTAQSDLLTASSVIETFPKASTNLTVYKDGKAYTESTGGGYYNYALARSGSVLQSFYLSNIRYSGIDNLDARMEVNAASNMFSIYYDLFSTQDVTGLKFEYDFNTADPDLTVVKWYNNDKTSGIVTLSSEDGKKNITFVAPLLKDGTRQTLEVVSQGVVKIKSNSEITCAGQEEAKARNRTFAIGLLVLPNVADPANAIHYVQPITTDYITAKGIAPYTKDLNVECDGLTGIYKVVLRSNGFRSGVDNDIIERVLVSAANAYNYEVKLMFMFTHTKGTAVYAIGSVPMIRETDGTPTGLPVQISKNWHSDGTPLVYDGAWQEYYTQLTIPGYKKIECEFSVAGNKWGNAYSASHAQLSLIGWSKGAKLLWEEAALASYTENICYAPTTNTFTNDIRGFLFTTKGTPAQGFASNVGGADFLTYVNSAGVRITLKDVKTSYIDLGPNLTLVKYTGITDDNAILVEYTTQIQRSTDLARIYHSFKYRILKNIKDAKVLSFYQYGTDFYNESGFDRFAYGNNTGLVKEYSNEELGKGTVTNSYTYVNGLSAIQLKGESVWLSWLGNNGLQENSGFGYADRALIVRNWSAKINGKETDTPYLNVRSARGHHNNYATNIMELGTGTKSLSIGDYVQGTLEMLVLPQSIDQYVGSEEQYSEALTKYAGTWSLAYYEALGNNIIASDLTNLKLVSSHPTVLSSVDGIGEMYVKITNGVSFVPLTFQNLKTNKNWVLEEKKGDEWVSIATTQEVHGNDYWQCHYYPETGTYTLVYNVYRDGRVAQSADYRLRQA